MLVRVWKVAEEPEIPLELPPGPIRDFITENGLEDLKWRLERAGVDLQGLTIISTQGQVQVCCAVIICSYHLAVLR